MIWVLRPPIVASAEFRAVTADPMLSCAAWRCAEYAALKVLMPCASVFADATTANCWVWLPGLAKQCRETVLQVAQQTAKIASRTGCAEHAVDCLKCNLGGLGAADQCILLGQGRLHGLVDLQLRRTRMHAKANAIGGHGSLRANLNRIAGR